MVAPGDPGEDRRHRTETKEPCPRKPAVEVNKPDNGTKVRKQELSFQNLQENLKVAQEIAPRGLLAASTSERLQLPAVVATKESSSTKNLVTATF